MEKSNNKKYLGILGAWALSFGCSVGWGSFVMPGTTFLPIAGPVGTALGLGLGGLVMLVLEDIESEHAVNGKEAVRMFEESEEGYYDAILMDVRMPEMDGLTATKTIRALDRPDAKSIPIIAMTANVFDEDIERTHEAGMNAHLSKPIEPEKMYETMARLISGSDKPDQSNTR